MSAAIPTFKRETFALSRALEFFSERELTAQIGFGQTIWPLALLKELVDNGLDACESANIPPCIIVERHADSLTVQDNGPGLPLAVI
jgi:DNA topoisomerase VI subunit B